MDQEEIDKVVLAYLDKRGFKQAGLAFQQEKQQHSKGSNSSSTAQIDPDIAKQILAFSEVDGPAQYQEGYSKLRSWAYSSLDQYQPVIVDQPFDGEFFLCLIQIAAQTKEQAIYNIAYDGMWLDCRSKMPELRHELVRVLYPVFIHAFMDLVAKGHIQEARAFFNSFRGDHEVGHSRDLQKLEGNGICTFPKASKVRIKICQYSYDLLLQYLHKSQSITMLGIINEHINFQVSPGQPISIADDAEFVTLFGGDQDAVNLINQKEIHWGLLEDSLEEKLEKTGGSNTDLEKGDGEMREGELEDSKKRSVDGGKQGTSLKKQKKEKVVSATAKASRPDTVTVSGAPRVKPELPLPVIPIEVEQSILEDLRNRVQLSSMALPSISFYTFINTHNSLNCASISHDGSMVAGGFSDSALKNSYSTGPENYSKEAFFYNSATFNRNVKLQIWVSLGENELASNDHTLGPNAGGRSYTLFRGHAGPVHSATFSPFGDFLLSSSSDSTIRLWSTKLNANLVCYKGHNYPVWDVQGPVIILMQFSPVGHYFASASHDRTARIWSVDRVQPLRVMAGHLSDVDCVQWHANCNYIATGSSDKTVRLWDVQSGECVRIFIGHRSMILCLAMSPDGRYMASGDEDGTIMMWDLATGRCVSPLVGHSSCIWSLAFSGLHCEIMDVTTSSKVPKTEENKSGSASRLRSLKTLPTKSTPVYALQVMKKSNICKAS
ncbi:Transcription initiation factor TFIID subunit [Sesamum angolense]|uniref:Transcription initiation factor TFIID subunit n=1 Tax=Sesamum angolense TaxID=2727404 RepID=A0AAE1XFX0_9LAMI|nr:Transcription initiation factor TFIID subunit [Sesamum angolense]